MEIEIGSGWYHKRNFDLIIKVYELKYDSVVYTWEIPPFFKFTLKIFEFLNDFSLKLTEEEQIVKDIIE